MEDVKKTMMMIEDQGTGRGQLLACSIDFCCLLFISYFHRTHGGIGMTTGWSSFGKTPGLRCYDLEGF